MFKSTVVAAIVSALVAGGTGAVASSWINGRQIRPHSIPLNRLTHRPVGLRGPQGPAGPAGPTGARGLEGFSGIATGGVAFFCVASDNSVKFTSPPVCPAGNRLLAVALAQVP